MSTINLTVFLGNPGKMYTKTRHNLAWMAAEAIPTIANLRFQKKFHGRWTDIKTGAYREVLLFPETYMNKSGESVSSACSFFKIDPKKEGSNLLVVHDEIELPFGTVELKRGGGTAGHNGLRSINQQTGSSDFLRLRLGVGRPPRGAVSSWVLSRFSEDEELLLPKFLQGTALLLEKLFAEGHASISAFKEQLL